MIPDNHADKSYVEKNSGVYFFTYSVPQMIAVNLGLGLDFGYSTNMYHNSIIFSDGCGRVETITSGPANAREWFKQVGFTPIVTQVAYLSHPDRAEISTNFDATAWIHPGVHKHFTITNWTRDDFVFAKNFVKSSINIISQTKYNLGGRNSNSVFSHICKITSQNATKSSDNQLYGISSVPPEFFQPGIDYDLFERKERHYIDLIRNWCEIVGKSALSIIRIAAARAKGFLDPSW